MTRRPRETWTLHLRDEPSPLNPHHAPPAEVRLRSALKRLLRGYGIRCRAIGPAAEPVRTHSRIRLTAAAYRIGHSGRQAAA